MYILVLLEKYFWLVFIVGFGVGLFFGHPAPVFEKMILPGMMAVLFLTFSKIEFQKVLQSLKRPFLLAYTCVIFLVVIPAIVFLIASVFDSQLAIAFLLLAAMPTGIVAPTFVDICKGDTALSVSITILSNLVSIVTIPLLFWGLTSTELSIDLFALAKTIFLLICVPLVGAQIAKKCIPQFEKRLVPHATVMNIVLLGGLFFIVGALQGDTLLENPKRVLITILGLYLLFFLLYFSGYSTSFWRSRTEKVTFAISKTYMNNALSLALAVSFFGPEITLIVVLSEIPFLTTLGIFRWIQRFEK